MIFMIISVDWYNVFFKLVENRVYFIFIKKYYKFFIIVSWVYLVFWVSGLLFKWGSIMLDEFMYICKFDWGGEGLGNKIYVFCLVIFVFVLFVGVMICVYCKIYCIVRFLWREVIYCSCFLSKFVEEGVLLIEVVVKKYKSNIVIIEDNKVLKIVLLLIGLFCVCWLLYMLVMVWKFFVLNLVLFLFVCVGLVLIFCNCCIDFFIYLIWDGKMK